MLKLTVVRVMVRGVRVGKMRKATLEKNKAQFCENKPPLY